MCASVCARLCGLRCYLLSLLFLSLSIFFFNISILIVLFFPSSVVILLTFSFWTLGRLERVLVFFPDARVSLAAAWLGLAAISFFLVFYSGPLLQGVSSAGQSLGEGASTGYVYSDCNSENILVTKMSEMARNCRRQGFAFFS